MIRIQSTTGQILQLNDSEIEFELNNWLLADSEDLPGSYSYPISFPLSENNRKFLQHSHLPESRPRDQAVTVWVNGIMLRKSTLSYKIQKKSASGYLKVDAGELAAKVKGVYLYEAMDEKVYLYNPVIPDTNSTEQKQAIVSAKILEIAKAEPGAYPITFFPIQNLKFNPTEFSGPNPDKYNWTPMINGWANDNFLIDSGGTYGRQIVPFIYVTYLIKRICTFLGYTATGSFINNIEVNKWVLYNTQTLYSTNLFTNDGLFADLRLHVPYYTISDFLKALRDDLGLGIYFDSNTLEARFELFDTIINSSISTRDLTPYTLSGFDSEIPDQKGFTVVGYQDGNDDLFKEYEPVSTKIKDGEKPIKAKIGTLKMLFDKNQNEQSMEWVIPQASQNGNLITGFYIYEKDYFNKTYEHKNDFGLRFLTYHGMQPASNGKLYPYATSMTTAYDQKKIGTWSLDAEQKDSVYQKITIPFYSFLANAKQLQYELLIPISKAKDMPFHKIYSLKGENSSLIKFIIDQFIFSAPGKHGLLPGKLKVFVLPASDALPNLVTGEIYFVELIQDNIRTILWDDRVSLTYMDLTFRIWADSNKTIPANPTNLNVRYDEFNTMGISNIINNLSISISGFETKIADILIADDSQGYFNEYKLVQSTDYTIIT